MSYRIYPLGGLGNQLFALAAAFVISGEKGDEVILDGSLTQFGSNLSRHFELTDVLQTKPRFLKIENDGFSRVLKAREWVRRKSHLPIPLLKHPSVEFVAQNPNLSELMILRSRFNTFSGQFQDFGVVDAAVRLGFPTVLTPSNPSENYLKVLAQLGSDFHAIHIRGGDYRNQRETYPLIPARFFSDAINDSSNLRTIIFTDDLKFVQGEYPGILLRASKVITSKSRLGSAETLALMSCAQVLTTSNSTFSTWAAWFASNRGAQINTVVPHHFDSWTDTLPKNWNRFDLSRND